MLPPLHTQIKKDLYQARHISADWAVIIARAGLSLSNVGQ